MKKYFALMATIGLAANMAACGNQKDTEQDLALSSASVSLETSSDSSDVANISAEDALTLVTDYTDKNFPGSFIVKNMETEPYVINNEEYYRMNVLTNVEKEYQITMEPIIAVKISDSSLWALYPDDSLVSIEDDAVYGINSENSPKATE